MPAVLFTEVIREDNPHRHRIIPQLVRALSMYISCWAKQKPISFTAPDILMMNIRSWENLVLSLPNKDHRNHNLPRKKINRQQKNNAIITMVDKILLNETQKVSATREALIVLDSDYDENNLYQVESMSLEENKEKLE